MSAAWLTRLWQARELQCRIISYTGLLNVDDSCDLSWIPFLFRGKGYFALGLERNAETFTAPLPDVVVGHLFQRFEDAVTALLADQRADAQDHARPRHICPRIARAGGHPVDDERSTFCEQHIAGMKIAVANTISIL